MPRQNLLTAEHDQDPKLDNNSNLTKLTQNYADLL